MEALVGMDVGTVYASYSEAVAWIEVLPEEHVDEVLRRLGGKVREGVTARQAAVGCVLPIFTDRSMSSQVVRKGTETVFDRDPRALRIMERVLGAVEQFSSGYAWVHHQEEVESATWLAMELSRYASSVDTVEDFWSLHRAILKPNDIHFPGWWDPVVDEALKDALEYQKVADPGRTEHRLLYKEGFMTEAEYQKLVVAEAQLRSALSLARSVFYRQHPRGLSFSKERAVAHLKEFGTAFYFLREEMAPQSYAVPAAQPKETAWAKPISKGGDANSAAAYQEFARKEAESGFSVYGYWFAPDGVVHPMRDFQAHDIWIRKTEGGGPGFSGGRLEALAAGWVSMTMMDDINPAANVAYGIGSDASKALKAAAKMVRRGGDFSSVVVEGYEDHYRSAEYQRHDDLRSGARHLNELAASARKPSPGM